MESQLQAPPSLLSDGIAPRGVGVLVVTIIMIFLASFFVFLRFMQRRRTTSMKGDDWACLVSLIVAYGFTAATVLLVAIGKVGNHTSQFQNDMPKIVLFCQLFMATDILAAASQSLAKVSVLLFYRRIFAVNKAFNLATWVIGLIVFGWFVSTTCGLIFASNPVEGEWNKWIPHTHINYKAFWVSYGSINLALDIAILCLPQPLIWKLKLSRRRKEQLSVVFLLGAFVCVASIIRIWVLADLYMDDMTYTLGTVAIWNVVEMAVGIICACLPMVPPLYRDLFGSNSKMNSRITSERTTNSSQRPLKGSFSGMGSSSSQGRIWGDKNYMDLESTDQVAPMSMEEAKNAGLYP